MNKYECITACVVALCITVLLILFAGDPDIHDMIVNIDALIDVAMAKVHIP